MSQVKQTPQRRRRRSRDRNNLLSVLSFNLSCVTFAHDSCHFSTVWPDIHVLALTPCFGRRKTARGCGGRGESLASKQLLELQRGERDAIAR